MGQTEHFEAMIQADREKLAKVTADLDRAWRQRDALQNQLSDLGEELNTLGHIVGVSYQAGARDARAIREAVQAKWHTVNTLGSKLDAVRAIHRRFYQAAITTTARTAGGAAMIQLLNDLTDVIEPHLARITELPEVELRVHVPPAEPQVGKLDGAGQAHIHPAFVAAGEVERGELVKVVGKEGTAQERRLVDAIFEAAAEIRRIKPATWTLTKIHEGLMAAVNGQKHNQAEESNRLLCDQVGRLQEEVAELNGQLRTQVEWACQVEENSRRTAADRNEWRDLAVHRRKCRNKALALLNLPLEDLQQTITEAVKILDDCAVKSHPLEASIDEVTAERDGLLAERGRLMGEIDRCREANQRDVETWTAQHQELKRQLDQRGKTLGEMTNRASRAETRAQALEGQIDTELKWGPTIDQVMGHLHDAKRKLSPTANGYGSVENAACQLDTLRRRGERNVPKDGNMVDRLSSRIKQLEIELSDTGGKLRTAEKELKIREHQLDQARADLVNVSKANQTHVAALQEIRRLRNGTMGASAGIENALTSVLGPDPQGPTAGDTIIMLTHRVQVLEKERMEMMTTIDKLGAEVVKTNGIFEQQAAEEDDLATENGELSEEVARLKGMLTPASRAEVVGALARGYTVGSNAFKPIDPTLIEAMADEVVKAFSGPEGVIENLEAEVSALTEKLTELDRAYDEQKTAIKDAEQLRKDLITLQHHRSSLIEQGEAIATDLVASRQHAREVETLNGELNAKLTERDREIVETERLVQRLRVRVGQRDQEVEDQEKAIAERDRSIQQQAKGLVERDQVIEAKNQHVRSLHGRICEVLHQVDVWVLARKLDDQDRRVVLDKFNGVTIDVTAELKRQVESLNRTCVSRGKQVDLLEGRIAAAVDLLERAFQRRPYTWNEHRALITLRGEPLTGEGPEPAYLDPDELNGQIGKLAKTVTDLKQRANKLDQAITRIAEQRPDMWRALNLTDTEGAKNIWRRIEGVIQSTAEKAA